MAVTLLTGTAYGATPARARGQAGILAPVLLPGTAGTAEPRIAVGPGGKLFALASLDTGPHPRAALFVSDDGGRSFAPRAPLPGQDQPSIDLDLAVATTGRVVAAELDARTLSVRAAYTDDGGRNWQASTGMAADVDRQWLVSGPGGRVYLVWHNFVSGLGAHEVLVQTSLDGGATFGAPVPVVPVGSPAFTDLACGDSTGPSSIVVNQATGRLFVSFATRTGVGGGCGQSLTPAGPRFNVVPSTHVWVASSPDGSAGTWTVSLAADTSSSNRPIALQYAPLAVSPSGAVLLTYTEGRAADDYSSDVRLTTSTDDGAHWGDPAVVAGSLPAMFPLVATDASGVTVLAYLHGVGSGQQTSWFPTVTVLAGRRHTSTTVSSFASHVGSPAAMAAHCAEGVSAGLQQGLLCNRYLDNFGFAAAGGRVAVIWPAPFAHLSGHTDGTYVTTLPDAGR